MRCLHSFLLGHLEAQVSLLLQLVPICMSHVPRAWCPLAGQRGSRAWYQHLLFPLLPRGRFGCLMPYRLRYPS